MEKLDLIYSIIIAAAPAITAIIGIIVAVIKAVNANKSEAKRVIEKLDEVREQVFDSKEYTTLKHQLEIVHQENVELKKNINNLLTKIDRISRPEA